MKRNSPKTYLIFLEVILTIVLVFLPHAVLAVEYTFTTIDASVDGFTYLYGINNLGSIVGVDVNSARSDEDGFLYKDGNYTIIDYPDATQTEANGINNLGQFVGLYFPGPYGFLYGDDGYAAINYPGAIQSTEVYGINDLGQIVGSYKNANGNFHGFLYSDETYTTMDYPGAAFTYLFGINNAGQIVGWYSLVSGEVHGFLYSGGSYTTVDFPGTSITEPCGINDHGQIVGWFGITRQHGFFAAPIREPITIDIKPGDDTNTINLRSKNISVAILFSPDFPAPDEEIVQDKTTLTFGATGIEKSLIGCTRKPKDVNRDGLPDLVCQFSTRVAFKCGDTVGILRGETSTGRLFEGSWEVTIAPCK